VVALSFLIAEFSREQCQIAYILAHFLTITREIPPISFTGLPYPLVNAELPSIIMHTR